MKYFYHPSAAEREAFAAQMRKIEAFCDANNIDYSYSKDSYYFELNGQNYRVSNHSVEASNRHGAHLYHPGGRREDTRYIHAGKTRIIQIYNDLKAGYELDGRGNRKGA